MIFLRPLENWAEGLFGGRINHYPLIRLIIFSLDKTFLYIIGFLLIEAVYLYNCKLKGKAINWRHQFIITVFSAYLIMLMHLTVLRYDWSWWQAEFNWQRPLSEMNFVPLVDTLKLLEGESVFSYWYNFFGNVVWFIPFGLIVPYLLRKRHTFFHTVGLGLLMSVTIELGQFWLTTGITHIDDVLFNVMGVILGYVGYDIIRVGLLQFSSKKEKHA